jgi:hypothetical protein
MPSSHTLVAVVMTLALSGCVLSVGRQPDGGHFAAHWIDLNANRKLAVLIRDKLENDPVTRGAGLSVKADDGIAYLAGSMSNPDLLARAVTLTLETEGVTSVRCDVTVIR